MWFLSKILFPERLLRKKNLIWIDAENIKTWKIIQILLLYIELSTKPMDFWRVR